MAREYRYNTLIDIEPFILKKFPHERDIFSMIIVASGPDTITKNLVQYLVNSHEDEISITSGEDLTSIHRKLINRHTAPEDLKRQLAIIDISPELKFKGMRTDISTLNPDVPDWLRNDYIRNIINPNMSIQPVEWWQHNYSHTIWLTDSVQNLPQVLTTNSHYLFLTENQHVNDFMKKRYANNFNHVPEEMLILGMNITQNMKIYTLPRNRFM